MMFAYRPSSGKDVYPERQRGNVSSRLEPHCVNEHIIQQLCFERGGGAHHCKVQRLLASLQQCQVTLRQDKNKHEDRTMCETDFRERFVRCLFLLVCSIPHEKKY